MLDVVQFASNRARSYTYVSFINRANQSCHYAVAIPVNRADQLLIRLMSTLDENQTNSVNSLLFQLTVL